MIYAFTACDGAPDVLLLYNEIFVAYDQVRLFFHASPDVDGVPGCWNGGEECDASPWMEYEHGAVILLGRSDDVQIRPPTRCRQERQIVTRLDRAAKRRPRNPECITPGLHVSEQASVDFPAG
jgi:hypothetical protein